MSDLPSEPAGGERVDAYLRAAAIPDVLPERQAEFVRVWREALAKGDAVWAAPCNLPSFRGYLVAVPGVTHATYVREELVAAVPRTVGLIGQLATPLSQFGAEAILRELGADLVLRVEANTSEDASRSAADLLMKLLLRWLQLRQRRPSLIVRSRLPLHQALLEFESALVRRDVHASQNYLDQLTLRPELSIENVRFLHFRRLFALGRWSEASLDPRWDLLVHAPKPRAIADGMLKVVWHVALAEEWAVGGAAQTASRFASRVPANWLPLFSTAHQAESREALLAVAGFALSRHPPREDLLTAVLESPALKVEDASDIRSKVVAPDVESADPLGDSLRDGEFDRVIEIAVSLEQQSARSIAAVVSAAFHLSDATIAVTVCNLVDDLAEGERDCLPNTPAFERMLESLREVARTVSTESRIIEDWDDWANVLLSDPTWSSASVVAQRGALEWRADSHAWPVERSAELAELILALAGQRTLNVLERALPSLLAWLDRAGFPSSMSPIADAVRYVFVLGDSLSEESALLVEVLAERQLRGGVSGNGYIQLLQDLTTVWERVDSFERLDWGLAIIDLLTRYPISDRGLFDGLLSLVMLRVRLSFRRCSSSQLAVARELAEESDRADLAPELLSEVPEAPSPWRRLDDAVVGIHCLMTPVAQRVASVVRTLCTPREIEIDDSHDCTSRLESLSQRADLILVATQHAKHAATDCVRQNLGLRTCLVEARQSSIGSSGLLAALEQALLTMES